MTTSHEIFDRTLLMERRKRAARGFSAFDFLLRRVGLDLRERVEAIARTFPLMANLGAHTGTIGEQFSGCEKVGRIIHADSCLDMVENCPDPKLVADEEFLPFGDGILDLAVSGLSLHFVNDVPGALTQIRKALKPDGLMLAAFFGGRTLFELKDAFARAEEELEGGASPHVAPFADIRDCGGLMQRAGFALPVADSDQITVTYGTPFELMHELRGMGASNVLKARRRTPLRQETLFRAVQHYQNLFSGEDGRIQATFEIITLTGWAPHESQQKPLKPGSAKHRLSDALGVEERRFGPQSGSGSPENNS